MSKLRAWLRLIRVAALPTALADVWVGAAAADEFGCWNVVWLSLISLGLYTAGMVLNDVHDVAADRTSNPRRPLPSGEISTPAAGVVGLALLGAATVGAAMVGPGTLLVAGLIALLVVSYNFVLKSTALGPLNMGLCRALNVVLGMSAVPPALRHEMLLNLKAAAPVFVYVVAVSYAARRERQGPARGPFVVLSVGIVVAAVLVPFVMFTEAAIRLPGLHDAWAAPLSNVGVPFLALMASATLTALWALWRTKDLVRVVTAALVGIVPLQALVALAQLRAHAVLAAGCIILLLVPILLLRRLSHIT